MEILFKNYKIIPASGRYDLYKIVERNRLDQYRQPTKETYTSEVNIGYGFRFDTLLGHIIMDMAENEQVSLTLGEYKKWYNDHMETLKTILDGEETIS